MRELLEKVSNLRMDKPLVGSEIHGFHTMQGIAAFSKEKKDCYFVYVSENDWFDY